MSSATASRVTGGLQAPGKLASGMRALAEVVAVTLGPAGRHVVLEHRSRLAPSLSKDGVEIARLMEVADRDEEMGLRLLRDAAVAISSSVGDGTTTAIILAAELSTRCMALVANQADARATRDGLALAAAQVLSELAKMTRPAGRRELEAVARTAANGDAQVASLLSEAHDRVGGDGTIGIEIGDSVEDVLEVKLGHHFESAALIRELLPLAGVRQLQRPLILLHDTELAKFDELMPAMEIARAEGRPLVILAGDVTEDVRIGLVKNARAGVVDVAVMRAPMYGDTRQECLADLALLCGGAAFVEGGSRLLRTLGREDLGSADSAFLDPQHVSLNGAHGDPAAVRDRIAFLRGEIASTPRGTASPSGHADYTDKCQERLQLLLGAKATLRLGGATDLAIKARMPIAENGRRALLAAAATGVLPGGGGAMLRASRSARMRLETLDGDSRLGAEALFSALQVPFAVLARNSGYRPGEAMSRILEREDFFHGLDLATGHYGDLGSSGVLDSFAMVRKIVTVAVGVAGSLLSTGALVSRTGDNVKPEHFHGTEKVYRKLAAVGAFDS